MASECRPSARDSAVPICTRCSPLAVTLTLAWERSDGAAEATQDGAAASPAPMPSATASAPTRPIYLEYLIVVALRNHVPADAAGACRSKPALSKLAAKA